MADVSGKFFSAVKVRTGVSPSSPGSLVGEPLEPVNPPGAGLSSVGITMPSAFVVANSPLTSNGTIEITGAGTIAQYVRGDGTLETFPSLTGFVPYTGATQNVNLGEFGVDAGFVKLDTTPTNTPTTQGTIFWDADDNTVDVVLNGYIMKIGEDLFYPVKNQTGTSITKGTAVRFAGTVGASGRLLIAPFIADGSVSSSFFMGVTAETIADGADGKVLYFGRIRGINTNSFNEGDVLYASTTVAGGFQTAVPVAPNNIVQVAAVITKSINQGVIFIRPSFGSNINQDEGVKIVSPTTGQLLQLQANGLWENKTKAQVLGGTSSQFVKGDGSLDSNVYALNSALANYQLTSEKGQPNGYASLDSNGKVPLVQINDALIGNVNFQGLWNAATNTPTLANPPASGTKGHYYIVSTAGTFASISFEVGDWIISDGTAWGKVDNTDAVSSVFGRTGNVTASNGDYNTSQVTENTNLYFTNARAIASVLTGYTSGAGTISAADTILSAIQKLNGNIGGLTTGVSSVFGRTGAVVAVNGDYYLGTTAIQAASANQGLTGITGITFVAQSTDSASITTTISSTSTFFDFNLSDDNLNDEWRWRFTPSGASVYNAMRLVPTTNTTSNLIVSGAISGFNLSGTNTGNVTLGTANGLGLTAQELSLGLASAGVTGALSGTDWTTFNNKQPALNGTGFVKIAGTTISYDNTNYLPLIGGTLTGALNGTTASFDNTVTINAQSLNHINLANKFYLIGGSNLHITNGAYFDNTFKYIDSVNPTGKLQIANTGSLVYSFAEIGTVNQNVTYTDLFTIDSTGSGSFSSSVTATSFIRSGGTSSQFLKADGSIDSNSYYLASNPSAFIALTALSGTAPIQYNNTTGAISITQASGSTNGFLSSTDWNTFNNKTSNVGTVTSVAALTLGTSGTDLSSTVANGTTTPVITLNVPTASAANRGALSATDWTTFNNKAPSVVGGYLPLSGGTMTGILNLLASQFYEGSPSAYALDANNSDIIGLNGLYFDDFADSPWEGINWYNTASSWDSLYSANGVLFYTPNRAFTTTGTSYTVYHSGNLINPVTGTGTAGQVAYWSSGSAITGESNLFWDATNDRLGIGTATPANPLHIVSNTVSQLNIQASSGNTNAQINLEPTGTGIALIGPATDVNLSFRTNFAIRWTITNNGILQSNGAQTIQSSSGILSIQPTGGVNLASVSGVVSSGGNINVGGQLTFTPAESRLISGSSSFGVNNNANDANQFRIENSTGAATFRSGIATSGYTASSSYAAIFNGAVGIGTNVPSTNNNLTLSSSTAFNLELINPGTGGVTWQIGATNNGYDSGGNRLVFTYGNASANSVLTLVQSTGNVGIGRNDPSFKLDVNGTGRFSGALTAATNSNFLGTSVNTRILVTATGVANTVVGFNNSGSTVNGVINNAGYIGILQNYPFIITVGDIERFRISATTGAATFSSSVTAASGLINGTTNAFFDINRASTGDAGRVRFQTGGTDEFEVGLKGGTPGFHITKGDVSELLTVLTSGNVGIGTASPATRLDVIGTHIGSIGLIRLTSSTTSETCAQTYYQSTTYRAATFVDASSNFNIWARGSSSIIFATNDTLTERMRITSGGNIGIGTNSPSYLFTVGQAGSTQDSVIQIASTTTGTGSLYFGDTTGTLFTSRMGGFQYSHFNDLMVFITNATEQMRILSSGNVLIGTATDSGAKLQVNGDIRTGALDGGYVAGYWKLGRALIGSQPSETHQIIVEINGALFAIGAASI
jgi:hypothetical protein